MHNLKYHSHSNDIYRIWFLYIYSHMYHSLRPIILFFLFFPITNMEIVLVLLLGSDGVATFFHLCDKSRHLALRGRLVVAFDRAVDVVTRHHYHQQAVPTKRGHVSMNLSSLESLPDSTHIMRRLSSLLCYIVRTLLYLGILVLTFPQFVIHITHTL